MASSAERLDRCRDPRRRHACPPRMSSQRFFLASLALPVVVPFAALATLILLQLGEPPGWVVQVLATLFGSVVALPLYVPLALVTARLLRRRTVRAHVVASFALPFALALLVAGCVTVPSMIDGLLDAGETLFVAGYWGGVTLAVAGFHVVLTHVLHAALRCAGVVAPE